MEELSPLVAQKMAQAVCAHPEEMLGSEMPDGSRMCFACKDWIKPKIERPTSQASLLKTRHQIKNIK